MAYTAFSDEINNRKKIIENTVTALDIYCLSQKQKNPYPRNGRYGFYIFIGRGRIQTSPYKHSRSEEHTSELQSQSKLVFPLLLEKRAKSIQSRSYYVIPATRPHHCDIYRDV